MKDMTSGNIRKNFIVFAIPMVLSGLLSQMYSVIDTIIAGKLIGESSLGAIGATTPLISFLSSVFWGCGNGFSIYIAEKFGAKDFSAIKKDILNYCAVMIPVMIILSSLTVIFKDTVFAVLKVDPDIYTEASEYFTVYGLGLPIILLNFWGVYLLNAFGSGSFPFFMSVVSSVLNIGGNIFSVAVLKLGVRGLALSSVLAAAVVDICYIVKLCTCFKEMGVLKEKYKPELKRLKLFTRYWVPTMFQQSSMYLSGIILSPMVNALGSDASASYTVALRIFDINASIFQNSAKTLSTYTAQCVGARKLDKIKKGMRVGLLQNVLFVAPVLITCIAIPKQICYLFFKSDYTGIGFTYSVAFLRYFLPFILFDLMGNFFHSFYRGVAVMKPLVFATVMGSLVKIVAGLILMNFFGMYGYFAGWVLAWIFDCIFGGGYYLFGSWRAQVEERLSLH